MDVLASQGRTWDVFLSHAFSVTSANGSAALLSYSSRSGATGPARFPASFSLTFAYKGDQPLGLDADELGELRAALVRGGGCQRHSARPRLEWGIERQPGCGYPFADLPVWRGR